MSSQYSLNFANVETIHIIIDQINMNQMLSTEDDKKIICDAIESHYIDFINELLEFEEVINPADIDEIIKFSKQWRGKDDDITKKLMDIKNRLS